MTGIKTPFVSKALERAVSDAFSKEITSRLHAKQEQYLDPKNTLEFKHGRRWENPANELGDKEGEVEQHSFEMNIHLDEVVDGDPIVIFKRVELVASEMHNAMQRMMFKKVDQATERTGNVVSAADHASFSEAFAQSFENIEMSVDEQGNLNMPTVFVAPQQGEKLVQQLQAQGPDFEKRIELIKERKQKEALQREQNRLARFERRG